MNSKTIKQAAWALLPAIILSFTACKDDKKEETPTPAKTLNKTTLTNNKTWYDKGSFIVNEFKSNGVFGADGQWRWVGNSDTMEIKRLARGNFVKWKMNWNTDTDMECEWIGNGPTREFKSTAW